MVDDHRHARAPGREAAENPALPLWVWTMSGFCSRRICSSRRNASQSFSG